MIEQGVARFHKSLSCWSDMRASHTGACRPVDARFRDGGLYPRRAGPRKPNAPYLTWVILAPILDPLL